VLHDDDLLSAESAECFAQPEGPLWAQSGPSPLRARRSALGRSRRLMPLRRRSEKSAKRSHAARDCCSTDQRPLLVIRPSGMARGRSAGMGR
jgi:hypothetical protein